jgi:hypothetical protein
MSRKDISPIVLEKKHIIGSPVRKIQGKCVKGVVLMHREGSRG